MHSVYSRHNNRCCTIRKLSHLTSRRNWHLTRLGKSAKIPTPLSGGAGQVCSRAKFCSPRPCCHFSKCSPHFTAFSVSSMWPHPPSHQAFTWLPIVSFSQTETVSLASSFTSGQPLHGWHIPGRGSECTSPSYPHSPSVVSSNPAALSTANTATTPKLYPGQTLPIASKLDAQHVHSDLY